MTEGHHQGLLDGVRRWFHRRERPLIVVWLGLLVVLNLLPVGWLVANRAWGIEDKLVRGYRWYWHQRYLSALAAERQDPARGLRSFEALLADLGPAQLRETTGRLRQDALLQVAALELEAGHPKRSMRVARRVTATDPYDVRGWVALGGALWARKKTKDATTAYRRALGMNPNLEHAVRRVMEYQADHADWEGVIATFEYYRNAVWSLPAYLQFTDSWPHFDVDHRIQIPILADGRRHTWRLHPAHPRAVGSFVFRTMGPIVGLALTTAVPGVVVELHALRFFPAPNRFTSPPAPIVEIDGFRGWKPGRDLVPLGPNRWLVRRGDAMLRAPISIPQPGKATRIELDMTVSKPVRPELEHLLRWACHNLGRDDEADELLRGMVVLPGPAPGQREPARLSAASPRATVPAVPQGYSIAVAGHLRRGPKDDPPLLPALVAAVPEISLRDRALVLTGDVVWEGTPVRWKRLDELLRRPLGIPLFIAPGNHDLFDGRAGAARERFVTLFGPTGRKERIEGSLLLVLDTEESPGDISTGQLEMALAAVDEAGRDPEISSVLVFLHRVLWFLGDSRYADVAKRANRSSVPGEPGNGDGHHFCSTLLPRLQELARTRAVAVVAGDVGTRLPLVFDRRGGVVLIASGNRAQDPPAWWNHYLRLHVEHGDLRFEAVPLGPASLGPVERYTPEFWKTHPATLRSPLEVHP